MCVREVDRSAEGFEGCESYGGVDLGYVCEPSKKMHLVFDGGANPDVWEWPCEREGFVSEELVVELFGAFCEELEDVLWAVFHDLEDFDEAFHGGEGYV